MAAMTAQSRMLPSSESGWSVIFSWRTCGAARTTRAERRTRTKGGGDVRGRLCRVGSARRGGGTKDAPSRRRLCRATRGRSRPTCGARARAGARGASPPRTTCSCGAGIGKGRRVARQDARGEGMQCAGGSARELDVEPTASSPKASGERVGTHRIVSYDVDAIGDSSKWTAMRPSYGRSGLGRTTDADTRANTLESEAAADERASTSQQKLGFQGDRPPRAMTVGGASAGAEGGVGREGARGRTSSCPAGTRRRRPRRRPTRAPTAGPRRACGRRSGRQP